MSQETIERIVIGSVLLDPEERAPQFVAALTSDHFDNHFRKKIAETMIGLWKAKVPPLPAIVNERLPPGHAVELAECMESTAGTMNVSFFVEKLRERQWVKSIASDTREIYSATNSFKDYDDPSDIISKVRRLGVERLNSAPKPDTNTQDIGTVLNNLISEIEKGEEQSLIRTGLKNLDKEIRGLIPGSYYILAGRTSSGKTTLATNLVNAAANSGKAAVFFSIEMTNTEIVKKLISMGSKIPVINMTVSGLFGDRLEKFQDSVESLSKKKINICSKFSRSIQKIESITKKAASEGLCDIIFVDYIQQLVFEGKNYLNRTAELTDISAKFKELALELNIPVVVLAQLNREAVSGGGYPQLHHLKDSGSLEQDADVVIFIHRPSLNLNRTDDSDDGDCLIIAKNRNGRTGLVPIELCLDVNIFKDKNEA